VSGNLEREHLRAVQDENRIEAERQKTKTQRHILGAVLGIISLVVGSVYYSQGVKYEVVGSKIDEVRSEYRDFKAESASDRRELREMMQGNKNLITDLLRQTQNLKENLAKQEAEVARLRDRIDNKYRN
jgi:hypothetical protein